MLAVMVAVLPAPLLSVRVNVAELETPFWAIVTLGGVLAPWPVVVLAHGDRAPGGVVDWIVVGVDQLDGAVNVPPLPTPLTEQVTAVMVV